MDVNWERWGRGAGIAFVVFTVLAFIVGGEPPQVSDSAEEVVAYYEGERGQVLVSSFLFIVALGFWIWFGGTLANSPPQPWRRTSRSDDRRSRGGVRVCAARDDRRQRSPRALGRAS